LRIQGRAAPIPRVVDVVDDSVLRVSKLWSFRSMLLSRSSEISPTSFTMRGSRSAVWATRVRLKPDTVDTTTAAMNIARTGRAVVIII